MLKKIKTIIACVLIVTIISTMGLAGLTAAAEESAAAPTVLSVTPSGEGLTRVCAGSVTFDSVMDRSTLSSENIKVTDATNGGNIVEQVKTSAYDTEYVFLCEFEPNTTYKITVGTNVKNAEGAALEEEYVHTFTTGDEIESIARANPDEAERYTHNSDGKHDGSLSAVYDGKLDGMYYTYNAEGPASRYVAIDLGKKSELSHISYVPKKAGWPDSWATNVKIQVATEPDFSDAVDLAITPVFEDLNADSGLIEWIAVPKDDTLYRYVRIIKNTINISAVELAVYNYPSTEIVEIDPVNIGLKKEISYNEYLGIYGSGVKTSVNDGVKTPSSYVAFNPARASEGEMAYFRFDLIKPYPISRINFYTRADSKSDTDNMTIYGSNEICSVDEMDVLYECPKGLELGQKNIIKLDKVGSYRYITFQKVANGHFCVAEVEIMSPTVINYHNDWKISNRASSYRVKLEDVETYEEGQEFLMLAMGYDEDGYLSYLDTVDYVLGKGIDDIDIQKEKPAGTKDVFVTAIDSFDSLKVNFRPKATPVSPFETTRAEISLKGEETAIFTILKNGKTFKDGFAKDDVLYVDMKMADENGKAKFAYDFKDTDATGVYEARTYITHADGTVSIEPYKIYYYTQESFDTMADEFDGADTNTGFEAVLEKYTETTPHFTLDAIPEVKAEKVSASIGEDFARVKDLYLKESGNSPDDVVEALKAAYVLYSAKNQSDSKVLAKYGDKVNGYDAKIHKDEKVLTMLSRLDDKITDSESFEEMCELACITSLMLDAGIGDTAEVIKTYAEKLGINLSDAEEKNVTVTEIAEKLDRKNPEQYIGSFGEVFAEIADEIYKERESAKSDRVDKGYGSSSSGSSKGGGGGFYQADVPETEDKPITAPQTTVSTNNGFADTKDIEWANEAICVLAENKILSGVDGVNFMPYREITREEFSKMIFLAFNLQRKDGKMSAFADCEKDAWYYPYVDALYSSEIINGISEELFGVGSFITRQDAAAILERVAGYYNKNMSKEDMHYTDTSEIAEYANSAVSKLSKSGIITGFDDGSFKPQSSITRAQAAVMIYRMMQYVGA